MAAMMMFMVMEQEEHKKDQQAILAYHKKESLIRKNIMLNGQNKVVVSYGIMWYSTYRIRGVNITEYRILATSDNMDAINERLPTIITTSLSKYKYAVHYLIYSVNGIDPNLVSYDVIKASTFPNVTMVVHEMNSAKLATITGDRALRHSIHITCLTNYNNYANQLRGRKKSEVKKLLNGWCLVYTKKNIIRLILIGEKQLLKNKY